ncbi:MAG: hypothetical protein KDE51_00810 [Anaerolineales bacterium]|nr:hypothetical protein [Anaerolineales bacterium]
MPTIDKFLGLWTLESGDYELGQPPQEGTYEISMLEDNKVNFAMNWTDQAGETHSMSYAEIADGEVHAYENQAIADEISLTLESDTVLNSVARKEGAVVLTAVRELVSDNKMKVVMSGMLPDGRPYHNIAFYKK